MKKIIIFLLVYIILKVESPFCLSQNTNGTLKITITGIKDSNGEIIFYLFNKKDGFPNDKAKAFKYIIGKIINGNCTVSFENLPFGEYAVYSFHDENNDKKLNTTWYGKPTEGVAVSNNAKGSIAGPPSFEAAKLDFKRQLEVLTIKMNYF
jgi:uncharacterized protein (DUF2141 family)